MTDDIKPENIPPELRELRQWVCWRYEERDGKKTKVPINANTRHEADVTDRSQFSTFQQALTAFRRHQGLDGIGFVFTDDDPFCGIDVDHCIDQGVLSEQAQNILQRFSGTYAEASPSGSGIKLWLRGSLPIPPDKTGRKIPKLGIETYCRGRYFTVTGQRVISPTSGRILRDPPAVTDHNDELQRWFAELFQTAKSDDKTDRTPAAPVSATVQQIVDKASGSKNGDKFSRLWSGDCSDYGDDHSSADQALCSMLAFWCGGHADLIDECFRASGLMRDKWEREDYRASTITKAVDRCSEFYSWPQAATDPDVNVNGIVDQANIVLSVPESQGTENSSVLSVPEPQKTNVEWPVLISLEDPPIERLPPDLLPSWYGDMIRAVAESTETPVEMAAMAALGAIATATMRKYDVLIEQGFSQSLNLYLVPVMEPGNRKSAVFRELMIPIQRFESELRKAAVEEIRAAESRSNTWRKRIEDLRSKAARAKGHGEFTNMQRQIEDMEAQTPEVPAMPQLTVDDATPESICTLLYQNDERLTLSSAEPELFDMMLGRYSSKPNLGIYLKGHDGDAHKENRKSGTPISLSAPLLTIIVMAQPEAIEQAGQQRVLKGRGLLARFLFVLPPSPVGYRDCITRPVPRAIADRYHDCLRRLLTVHVEKDDFDRPRPRIIRLSQAAHKLWKQEQLRIEHDQRDGGRLAAFKDWAGKFPAAVARIAANLHVANCVESGQAPDVLPIPGETMQTAISLARVIETQTTAAFGIMNTDSNRRTAVKIIKTIRDERLQEISKRECMRADRTMTSAADVEPAIELLVRDGYLVPIPDDNNRRGRPSERYRVNPAVLVFEGVRCWDKKDKKDENPVETEPAFNSVLFVPDSDEPETVSPSVDDFEFSFPGEVPF